MAFGEDDHCHESINSIIIYLFTAMAGGLGVLYGKDPLNLPIEDQISFAAQVIMGDITIVIFLFMIFTTR